MKSLRINSHSIIAAFIVTLSLAISSCDKEEVTNSCSGGTPKITRIVKPTDNSDVLMGNFDQYITVEGENFCGVNSIILNDIEIDLKEAYVTPDKITFLIPRAIPVTITDKIKVKTTSGESEFNFPVFIPPTVLTGADFEWAAAGTEMVLLGQNLLGYNLQTSGKVLFGDVEAQVNRVTQDSIFVTVPQGISQGSVVKIRSGSGVEKVAPFRYRDNRNLFFDFDGKNGTTSGTITSTAGPAAYSNNYVRINQTVPAWDPNVIVVQGSVTLPADVIANPNSYVLKFEVNTQKPFDNNAIKFFPDRINGSSPHFVWNGKNVKLDTKGKWKTISIDLSSTGISTPMPARTQHVLRLAFHGDGNLNADMSFDNIRIVPKQ